MADIKTALSTAFTGVSTDVTSLLVLALPAALAIVGIKMAVKIGINFFSTISTSK